MSANPQTFHFKLSNQDRPKFMIPIPEIWYPGVKDYWPKATTKRIYHPINGVKAVVIHATDGSNSSGAVSQIKLGVSSFHWLVPDENEEQHGKIIWACVPEALSAHHVRKDKFHPDVNDGMKRVNHWSLGIEIVNNQDLSDTFSDWQIKITAAIVRYCWAKYPNLSDVVSHAKLDPGRRSDPGVNFPWSLFESYVKDSDSFSPNLFTANMGGDNFSEYMEKISNIEGRL